MKKFFLFLGIALTATFIACGPTTDDAIKHNDSIVADQKEMLELESNFVDAIVNGDDEGDIKSSFKEYKDFLSETKKKYDEMEAFDDKDTFRKAMIDLLDVFSKVADKEYEEMVEIYTKDAEELTEEDFERWEELTTIVDEKEAKANDAFLDAQKEFAKEYNFELK